MEQLPSNGTDIYHENSEKYEGKGAQVGLREK